MVDAPALGAGGATRGGSSPSIRIAPMIKRLAEKIASQPERGVFVAASAALVAAGVARSKRIETIAKPLVMLSIQAGLWRTRNQRPAADNALLAVATTASFAGDWLMLEEEFAPNEKEADRWIVRGASAFAVNHVAMIALAIKLRARPRPTDFAARMPGLVEGLALLATRRHHLLMPLGSYSKLLALMSTTMAAPQLKTDSEQDSRLPGRLEIGGLSFLASDGTILHRRIFLSEERPRAAAEAFVLASYCLAQRLLVDGLDAASVRVAAGR